MATSTDNLQVKITVDNTQAIKSVQTFHDKMDNLRKKAGIALSAIGGIGLIIGKQFVEAADGLEQSQIAFETMLGSAEKAKILLAEIAEFAAKTPFELPEVEKGAKSLLAFGIAQESILPTLKSLGDISAGLNVPIERLILNYGQVFAQTKLTGRELRDFAVAGVPLLDELANSLGKSKAEISDMVSRGEIGFDKVEAAFASMTGEGGRFNDLMDKQSKTFSGMVSNLQDQITLFMRQGGAPLLDVMKEIVTWLGNILEKVANWVMANPELTVTIVKISAAIVAVSAVLGPLLLLLPGIIAAVNLLKVAFIAMTGPIGLVVLAVAALATAVVMNWDIIKETTINVWTSVKDFILGIWDSITNGISNSIQAIGNLFGGLTSKFNSIKNTISTGMSKVKGVLGFAEGGFVPEVKGYASGGIASSDTVPAMLTPGELILNKAQQKNLAGNMSGGITVNIGKFIGEKQFAMQVGDIISKQLGLSTAMV